MLEKPNAATIAGRTLRDILWHPLVYTPFTGLAVANVFLPLHAWLNIPVALAFAAGETFYWKRNWNYLFRQHETASEIEYRAAQNARYRLEIKQRKDGSPEIATAIQLKEEIERLIFSDGGISTKEKELLDLIEESVEQMLETTRNNPTGIVPAEVTDAVATLRELHQDFNFITRPLSPTDTEKHTINQEGLAETTRALRDRMNEASQIRRIVEETKERSKS